MGAMIGQAVIQSGGFFANLTKDFFHLFGFGGANPDQVPATIIEQSFEIASDTILNLYKNSWIDKATALVLQQSLIQALPQAMQASPIYARDPGPFNNGITHGTQVMGAETNAIQSIPDSPVKTWNLQQAQADVQAFINSSYFSTWSVKHGGHAQVISGATQLMNTILTALDKQYTYSVAGVSISKNKANIALLAAAGIVAWEVI